ncbi:hypothetical protein Poli38472_002040 [Pythium oligandrum]|uniref:Mitotic spindle assembly checkpoint protein MAD1 n=1 Tax=Pythium oligandrum TaxID=41045 RepID=A0A8K1CGH6_PYTOL|nr:hypothetical protein Poli38472_002040 [Pythium oligandrum]|eukprot:TMW63099.1 hypothetical protein Poli38472_002040 [Pythium oligandrum]
MNPPQCPRDLITTRGNMDGSRRPMDAASFLCSPIPKDPTQLLFMGGTPSASDLPKSRGDSIFDEEMKAETEGRPPLSASKRRQSLPRDMAVVSRDNGALRTTKRPRLEAESVAIVKCDQLTTEIESLRVQLEQKRERHQIELKERDLQVEQLRRQLQYAVTEEEHTRKELKTLTSEYATEKLQLQKKIVELDSKLQFVESTLSEWKEKALESASEVRTVTRQSNLKIQLLTDELEALKTTSASSSLSEQSVAESKVRLLESRLREQEVLAEQATSKLLNASLTVESSKEVRSLKERIAEMETHERRLKTELVELIESSKRSSIHEEKLHSLRQKLTASEQRCAQAQQQVESMGLIQAKLNDLRQFVETLILSKKELLISKDLLQDNPVIAAIQLFKALDQEVKELRDAKRTLHGDIGKLTMENEKLTEAHSSFERQATVEAEQRKELQSEVVTANNAVSHMRKVNEELVALLQTYEKSADEKSSSDVTATRLSLLESALQETAPMVKTVESLVAQLSSSTTAKSYEAELSRLKDELKLAHSENSKLSQHLERVETENTTMERRLGRGELNTETTKVVHLAVNPTSELLRAKGGEDELEKLRKENEQLRAELNKQVSSGPAATPATPITLSSESKLTTTTSYETVEGQKILNQRLKQVFREQIQQYREAVYQLTGFKVDLKKSNGIELLRLRSMYADHDDDELLVRMESNGALELLETDYCAQINQRVFAYLTTCKSFPAFLATLTLHLFEKQTFQG